jgi:hypothetical protein
VASHNLLGTKKNAALDAIQAIGLDPAEFSWFAYAQLLDF